MADQTLTPDVKETLSKGSFSNEGLHYKLPEQLQPDYYKKVALILKMIGALWNKAKGCHIFERDGRPLMQAIFETGIVPDMIKRRQAYYTPREVAEAFLATTYCEEQKVLEPSAGKGGLAEVVRDKGGEVTCYEIDPFESIELREKGFPTTTVDFLTVTPEPVYDIVVMNPPFNKGQDVKHVEHALKFLKPFGKLLAIVSPTFPISKLREYAEKYGIEQIEFEVIEAGAFKKSGTGIETRKLKIIVKENPGKNDSEIDWRGHQLAIEVIHGEPAERIYKIIHRPISRKEMLKKIREITWETGQRNYRSIEHTKECLINLIVDDELLEKICEEAYTEVISAWEEDMPAEETPEETPEEKIPAQGTGTTTAASVKVKAGTEEKTPEKEPIVPEAPESEKKPVQQTTRTPVETPKKTKAAGTPSNQLDMFALLDTQA